MSRTVVGIHSFHTYPGHRGRDGANLAYEEIGLLLDQDSSIELQRHDLRQLLADDGLARRTLAKCDVVVATVGPHAYFYFYLRERLSLNYRIVRDVRTALWNGYLLQEKLAAPFLRAEDAVVYSTAFSRDLFHLLLPTVPRSSQFVCYPLVHFFPPLEETSRKRLERTSPLTIGYVGRLTTDKNFDQALELIDLLESRRPGRFRLRAVGEGPYRRDHVSRRPKRTPSAHEWVPPVGRQEIWHHLREFDVLFFPSTSSLETFGRVLAEASHAGVPVVASSHGPCLELVEESALLPTRYTARTFTSHFAVPLGRVDVEAASELLLDQSPIALSSVHERYAADPAEFIQLVRDGGVRSDQFQRRGSTQQDAFLRRLRAHGLDKPLEPAAADAAIDKLRGMFVGLHQFMHPSHVRSLVELLVRSRYRQKTLQFAYRSLRFHEDFSNIGGIDLQFSHVLNFYPGFELAPEEPAPADVIKGQRASGVGIGSQ